MGRAPTRRKPPDSVALPATITVAHRQLTPLEARIEPGRLRSLQTFEGGLH
jgi:hypothetical protein